MPLIPRVGRLAGAVLWLLPSMATATTVAPPPDYTYTGFGLLALAIFIVAYVIVIAEEFTELRKSKPVIVAAGAIWILVALAYADRDDTGLAAGMLRANLIEYAELLLFLISAMTYVNTIEERNVFQALRARLVSSGYTLRAIYWLTGGLAFFISPLADNLTTALIMGAVVLAIGKGNDRFIAVACINIVVAANAGGAFSPFGDITTLMVWQRGVVRFEEFFALFIPAAVNWLVPAACMAFAVGAGRPAAVTETARVKPGGFVVIGMFLGTIAGTVALHQFLHLPPFLGMMTGLGLLKVYGYKLRRDELRQPPDVPDPRSVSGARFDETALALRGYYKPAVKPFDIFISVKRIEWDTLMFFYGILLCVGGLGALGYLVLLSNSLYAGLGPTVANVLLGIASAVIDNIPVMYAVLNMSLDMAHGQWLLVTLTAGVGGSLLSIGSAAGVALMGQARGTYTFFAHLKWTWAVALGYAASIGVHLWLNARLF